jgi:hypothetical protein
MSTINDAVETVQDAADYVADASADAADVTRVQEVLAFIRKEATVLQRYAGDKLKDSIVAL